MGIYYGGAGIGAGCNKYLENTGDGNDVIINGGVIYAQGGLGDEGNGVAIGHGGGSTTNGPLSLPDNYSVKAGSSSSTATLQTASNREAGCRQLYAQIEPCIHDGATFTDNGNGVDFSNCSHCLTGSGTEPYTFQTAGNWNVNTNWFGSIMPGEGKDVTVKAAATIPNNCIANVGNVDLQEDGSLTITDSGQLKHSNAGVVATVEKNITAYNGNGGYYLLTNPVANEQDPSTLGMLDNDNDLYWFDQSQELEWRNYEQQSFNLENGIGYLYANDTVKELTFSGVLNPANADISVSLTYDDNADFKGLNLVGNPFVCNAYLLDENNEIMPFFKMNDTGDTLVAAQAGTAIKPCESVFVICPNDGQTHSVIFTTTAPATLGETAEVPAMLLPIHALPEHQDASLNNHVQTIELLQGWNWWSTNLDITLDQLTVAIADALETEGTASIKSRNGSISYANGQWRGNFNFDIRQMYKIEVSADCEITLTGVPVNPSEYEITISHGINWIGFLPNESMSVNEAFSGLNPVTGDVVKSKNGSVTYNGTVWRGTLTLEPRNGYIYQSEAAGDKTFTFPTGTR